MDQSGADKEMEKSEDVEYEEEEEEAEGAEEDAEQAEEAEQAEQAEEAEQAEKVELELEADVEKDVQEVEAKAEAEAEVEANAEVEAEGVEAEVEANAEVEAEGDTEEGAGTPLCCSAHSSSPLSFSDDSSPLSNCVLSARQAERVLRQVCSVDLDRVAVEILVADLLRILGCTIFKLTSQAPDTTERRFKDLVCLAETSACSLWIERVHLTAVAQRLMGCLNNVTLDSRSPRVVVHHSASIDGETLVAILNQSHVTSIYLLKYGQKTPLSSDAARTLLNGVRNSDSVAARGGGGGGQAGWVGGKAGQARGKHMTGLLQVHSKF